MNACTGISAIQLLAMALTFLLAVLSLDVFWVRVRERAASRRHRWRAQETELAQCIRRLRRGRRRDTAAALGQLLYRRHALR